MEGRTFALNHVGSGDVVAAAVGWEVGIITGESTSRGGGGCVHH